MREFSLDELENFNYSRIAEKASYTVVKDWLNEEYPNEDRMHLIVRLANEFHNTQADARLAYGILVYGCEDETIARKVAEIALKRREAGTLRGYSILASLIHLYKHFVRPCHRCKKKAVFALWPKEYFTVCEECNKGVDNHV
jgi:hypothetical protein